MKKKNPVESCEEGGNTDPHGTMVLGDRLEKGVGGGGGREMLENRDDTVFFPGSVAGKENLGGGRRGE